MDNLQASKEVSALKKLREEYERQLKLFGLDLSHLPDELLSLINEYAEIKSTTKLHELDINYLKEYYYNERKEQIDNFLLTKKLENDIRNLENKIENENTEIKNLQNFSNSINTRIGSSTAIETNETQIEQKIEGIQKIENTLAIPKDINIDDLIAKVELLEKKKKAKQ